MLFILGYSKSDRLFLNYLTKPFFCDDKRLRTNWYNTSEFIVQTHELLTKLRRLKLKTKYNGLGKTLRIFPWFALGILHQMAIAITLLLCLTTMNAVYSSHVNKTCPVFASHVNISCSIRCCCTVDWSNRTSAKCGIRRMDPLSMKDVRLPKDLFSL